VTQAECSDRAHPVPVARKAHPVFDTVTRFLGAMLLRLPTWAAVAAISGTSVALTVGAVLAVHVLGPGYGDGLRRALTMGSVMPLIVSAPVGWIVVGLLRALEREHARVLALAGHDALTGLANRRTATERAHRDIDLARRGGRPLAIALLDLDEFKAANDRHGHAVGDALLCATAEACRRTVRAADTVARWGGEEIVIVMPDTDPAGAAVLMERVRDAVSASRVPGTDGEAVGCTASIGVAGLEPADGVPPTPSVFEQLVATADRAMYDAKRSGRDRVRIAA